MSTSAKPSNIAIVVIEGRNSASNIIYGASRATITGNITTSYELFAGSHAYNDLVGDTNSLFDSQYTVGNLLIGCVYATNLMIGSPHYADSSKPARPERGRAGRRRFHVRVKSSGATPSA